MKNPVSWCLHKLKNNFGLINTFGFTVIPCDEYTLIIEVLKLQSSTKDTEKR